jgi:formylglycine-generating enzyme required for sulfatase activity
MLIALKLKALAVGVTAITPLLFMAFTPPAPQRVPEGAVMLTSDAFDYRVAGDFSRDGKPAANPLHQVRIPHGLVVMKNQVTAAEYARCMADGACPRVTLPAGPGEVPMVGVSWHDATAYAQWISMKTGVVHRLPTDEEWSFAAAEKIGDESLAVVDPADPAQAWLARYETEAARGRPSVAAPQPAGTFGDNS